MSDLTVTPDVPVGGSVGGNSDALVVAQSSLEPAATPEAYVAPIDRLPDSILANIFVHRYVDACSGMYSWCAVSGWGQSHGLAAALVCRKWHRILLETTEIWQHIDVFVDGIPHSGSRLDTFRRALSRSRNHPLYLGFHEELVAERALPLLTSHSKLLHQLSFGFGSGGDRGPTILGQTFGLDLSNLQELCVFSNGRHVDNWRRPEDMQSQFIPSPTPQILPSLRVLRLHAASFPWVDAPAVFRHLRVLNLENISVLPNGTRISLDAFLAPFENCCELEELSLVARLPIDFTRPESARVVELPKLRLLSVRWDIIGENHVPQLLDHIRTPPTASISVRIGGGIQRGDQSVHNKIPDAISLDSPCLLPFLHGTALSLRVRYEGGETSFLVKSACGGSFMISVDTYPGGIFDRYKMEEQLDHFITLFSEARFDSLTIESEEFTTQQLLDVFGSDPLGGLSKLEIRLQTPRALRRLLSALLATPGPAAGEEGPSVVLPALGELRVIDVPWDLELFQYLELLVFDRKSRGANLWNLLVEAYGRSRAVAEAGPGVIQEFEICHGRLIEEVGENSVSIVDVPRLDPQEPWEVVGPGPVLSTLKVTPGLGTDIS
ncbi:hypothetical protein C8Q78DRAFT_224354 [Trametes maxima]|nr:hypothetical protein C8Q78DRAFT_224354 [Trametes maxima]